jgi:hypothetical protein
VDAAAKVLLVLGSPDAATECVLPVQGEADGLKEGCLPGTVLPAEDHDRPPPAVTHPWLKIELDCPAVEAEVFKY